MGVIRKIQTIRAKRFERKYEIISDVEFIKMDDNYGGNFFYPLYVLKKVRRKKIQVVKNDKKILSGIKLSS